MEIAPNFTAQQWRNLNLADSEHDWQIAIDVLNSRINARFIEPVNTLIKFEENVKASERHFGFSILAIDLLLIETIQAFKDGLVSTEGKSKKTFTKFLAESSYFSEYFPSTDSRDNFYTDFRCGILHQAEIQSSALLWSIGDLYTREDGFEVLNRTAFHKALIADFDAYILKLRAPKEQTLRNNMKAKMDSVAARDKII